MAWQILLLVVMFLSLLAVPIGLPGVWIMVALLLGGVLAGWVTWLTWGVLAGLAAVAEVGELALLRWVGDRYGGGRGAFWGAILGGVVGVFVGLPVPVLGPVIAGFLGTFAGAGAVTLYRTRNVRSAARAGWGVVLARTLAVGLKVGVGVVVLATSAVAFVLS